MPSNKIFIMKTEQMGPLELMTWLHGTADLQEAHDFHGKTMPEWVPGAVKFRWHADELKPFADPAVLKDPAMSKLCEEKLWAARRSIKQNADYIWLRSEIENDESLRHGMGYEVKEKSLKRTYVHPRISAMPLMVGLKHGSEPGSILVIIEKDPAAGVYQVQICKGEPTGEDSWKDYGNFKSHRPMLQNLERASWIYVRARSHGDNETSPWSNPVCIIVL